MDRKNTIDTENDFNPSLRNTQGSTWEATMEIPIIGKVTTRGCGWEEAKMRLWLVKEAVRMLAEKSQKEPKDFTEAEWRLTLKTMRDVLGNK